MFSKSFKAFSPAKRIAFTAVFLALSVVANTLIDIDLTPNNKLTFTYLICFFAAWLLGGLPGFAVAFVGDGIGFLIKPSGTYWLFGLTLGLYALLAGVLMNHLPFKGKGGVYIKAAISFVACYLAITVCLNTVVNYYYVKIFIYNGDYNKAFFAYLAGRIGIQTAVFAVNVGASFALIPAVMRISFFFPKKRSEEKQITE